MSPSLLYPQQEPLINYNKLLVTAITEISSHSLAYLHYLVTWVVLIKLISSL